MTSSLVSSSNTAGLMQDLPCTQVKVDQFLLEWLAIEDTQTLVLQLTDSSAKGLSVKQLNLLGPTSPRQTAGPPISPRTKSPRSPFSPRTRQILDVAAAVEQQQQRKVDEGTVPRFYYPGGKPLPKIQLEMIYSLIIRDFNRNPQGLGMQEFVVLLDQIFHLPEMLGILLYQKLANKKTGTVDKHVFTNWWEQRGFLGLDKCQKLFEIIKQDDKNYIEFSDLMRLLDVVLDQHPGLEFLAQAPDFRQRYAETVVYRIQYDICKLSCSDRIHLRQLKKHGAKLWEALENLDDDCEVNAELLYFSYEHFYVICCKFWELDTDHDLLLDQDNLLRYGTCALTFKIVQRIFSGAPKALEGKKIQGQGQGQGYFQGYPQKYPQTQGQEQEQLYMNYRDFVYFILSEEDKTTDVSIEYWFRCLDLDGTGFLDPATVEYFFEEQQSRMMCMNQESIRFQDVWAQMADMLKPSHPCGFITLQDLMRNKQLSCHFLDTLFNIHKFQNLENQDPFAVKAEQQRLSDMTEWQRFALNEYQQMSMEDAQEGTRQVQTEQPSQEKWEASSSDSTDTAGSE